LEILRLCKTHGNGVKMLSGDVLSLRCISKWFCQSIKRSLLVELWKDHLIVERGVPESGVELA